MPFDSHIHCLIAIKKIICKIIPAIRHQSFRLIPVYGLVWLSLFANCIPVQANGDTQALIDNGQYDAAVQQANNDNHYLAELIKSANAQKLAEHPVWKALMLYKKGLLGTRSEVDSADFFLSDSGATNAQSELLATLAAFFSDLPVKPSKYSPQCRFPGRFYWLNQQLNFDGNRLPVKACADLHTYYKAMDPSSLTVVFPSTHPNSPSSMFGHTLLRVNKKGQTAETRMLAFSINYAAQIPPDQDPLSYAVGGLAGGFYGKFMVLPYYIKIREYAQLENRDLWEYDLKLDEEQIKFVLYHTFELAYSVFDYYFFTENCSYHLLSLLDVIYADNPLTNEFKGWTIPVDTLKLLESRGLVESVRFYPSLVRKINYRRGELSTADQKWVLDAEKNGVDSKIDEIKTLPELEQVKTLDLLSDYLRYRKIKTSGKTVSAKLNKPERQTLLYRSKIHLTQSKLAIPIPDARPDQGHNTARLGFSYGLNDNLHFTDLEWRAAYHDTLDNSKGFVSNSGLDFMKIKVRHTQETERTQLQQIDILDLASLEPRDSYFHGVSWYLKLGWQRARLDNSEQLKNLTRIGGGKGVTYNLDADGHSLVYGFADINALYGTDLNASYQLAPGVLTGYISEPIRHWRIKAEASFRKGAFGDKRVFATLNLAQSVAINDDFNVRLLLQRDRSDTYYFNSVSGQFFWYF